MKHVFLLILIFTNLCLVNSQTLTSPKDTILPDTTPYIVGRIDDKEYPIEIKHVKSEKKNTPCPVLYSIYTNKNKYKTWKITYKGKISSVIDIRFNEVEPAIYMLTISSKEYNVFIKSVKSYLLRETDTELIFEDISGNIVKMSKS